MYVGTMCPGRVGDVLGTRWGHVGDALGTCWGRVGDVSGTHWGRAGDFAYIGTFFSKLCSGLYPPRIAPILTKKYAF